MTAPVVMNPRAAAIIVETSAVRRRKDSDCDALTMRAYPVRFRSEGSAPAGLRRVHQDPRAVGPLANVPELRRDALLRFVAQPPREQARASQQASGDRIGAAG